MTRAIDIGPDGIRLDDVVAIAREGRPAALTPAAWDRISASNETLRALASAGTAIYGVSTGLGAAVDTKVSPEDAGVQQRVPLARAVGVGRPAERDVVRAIVAARLSRLAGGRSGASPATVSALLGLLNAGVHPVVPLSGSVGQADLAPLAHVASALIGVGEAEYRGAVLPAGDALARAGLAPARLEGKDGLALVSSNAGSVGLAALTLADATRAFAGLSAAAALSYEGFRANLAPLSPRAVDLHPVPGQAEVAEALRDALAGGDLARPGAARRLQDPLSLRNVAPVHGALWAVLSAARDAVDLELATSDDNPAILADEGLSVPNANFDTTHLTLALETLGLALSRVAALAGERVMKLMSPAASDLPRFLSPLQEGRNGFATVQKTVSGLVAEIQHLALPMPTVILAVADRVEDYGTMAMATAEKTGAIVDRLRSLAAIELMVAAQACDLREGIALGRGTGAIHATIRAEVATLRDDRPAAPDILALDARIRAGAFDAFLPRILGAPR